MANEAQPQVVSVESVLWSRYPRSTSQAWHWKVVLACDDSDGNRIVEATFHISKKDFRDDQILKVARRWMAGWSKNIAEATKDWTMTQEEWAETLIAPPKKPDTP